MSIFAAYPGTPSSEILPAVVRFKKENDLDIYVEWSTNEKVAFERHANPISELESATPGVILFPLMENVCFPSKREILTSGTYNNQRDITGWEVEKRAAERAYEMASLGPKDIDLVEVHDAFTISEIIHYEDLGLCAPGEGSCLIDEGVTELGGRIPVNPSGGLLAKGHPVGASGVAQVAEIVWQLRGEAGKRQVKNPRVGLAQIMGGYKEGDTRACTVHILIKD